MLPDGETNSPPSAVCMGTSVVDAAVEVVEGTVVECEVGVVGKPAEVGRAVAVVGDPDPQPVRATPTATTMSRACPTRNLINGTT
jgi:hypothetical protein